MGPRDRTSVRGASGRSPLHRQAGARCPVAIRRRSRPREARVPPAESISSHGSDWFSLVRLLPDRARATRTRVSGSADKPINPPDQQTIRPSVRLDLRGGAFVSARAVSAGGSPIDERDPSLMTCRQAPFGPSSVVRTRHPSWLVCDAFRMRAIRSVSWIACLVLGAATAAHADPGDLITTFSATAYDFARNPSNAELYATTDAGILVIDTATLAAVTTIPLAGSPRGVAASPDGSRLYVAHSTAAQLSVIDLAASSPPTPPPPPPIFAAPAIERLLRDVVLAAHVSNVSRGPRRLQDPDDLLLRESRFPHLPPASTRRGRLTQRLVPV